MKRRRPFTSPGSAVKCTAPSTPPTPRNVDITQFAKTKTNLNSETLSHSSNRPSKRSLSQILKIQNLPTDKWVPLDLGKSELSLPLTFPTGQTFRWKKTGTLQYTGVVKSHLVSLKHLENGDVAYQFHPVICSNSSSISNFTEKEDAKIALLDFLNVGIRLADLWESFAAFDQRFSELAPHLAGARVLRQDPLECLIQFLCSSNNNIQRITRMVDYISSLGHYLGSVEGFQFYQFPSLERLAMISEEELREAGFGYRAKYIVGTVKALQLKPGGGVEWLSSLRELDLKEVINELSTFPGVGPKVASCIALFSLDQHHAVPVDTHVWKVATRYFMPELAGVRMTPKLCSSVAEAFVTRYGKYAGWAQTLLFVSELPSQKAIIPSEVCYMKEKNLLDKKVIL
ncbi:N-glycosylase/DNA lyase OGG1-like [Chenopodium quinoa]|uniref:DNA-(apurinic or apyrimidinic site) lyase n=1 Tax=Chenopodium quinoa TaxID=63459 RepID=A0A803KTA9_CHEQI|nr:N-glycosylase/DNA lyase OGG1-like [Chenopodium quinoa]